MPGKKQKTRYQRTTSPALPLNVPTFILAILNRRLSTS